jgi:hypothetical protein
MIEYKDEDGNIGVIYLTIGTHRYQNNYKICWRLRRGIDGNDEFALFKDDNRDIRDARTRISLWLSGSFLTFLTPWTDRIYNWVIEADEDRINKIKIMMGLNGNMRREDINFDSSEE